MAPFFAPQCSANDGSSTIERDIAVVPHNAASTPLPSRCFTAPRPPSGGGAGFSSYELRKTEWVLLNPGSSPAEYTAAMQRIAQECGV